MRREPQRAEFRMEPQRRLEEAPVGLDIERLRMRKKNFRRTPTGATELPEEIASSGHQRVVNLVRSDHVRVINGVADVHKAAPLHKEGETAFAIEVLINGERPKRSANRGGISHDLAYDAQIGKMPRASAQEPEMRAARPLRGLLEKRTHRRI